MIGRNENFDIFLEDEMGNILPIMCLPFWLQSDTYETNYQNEHDKLNVRQFIATIERRELQDNYIRLVGNPHNFEQWEMIRDWILPENKKIRLHYKDYAEKIDWFCDMRYSSHSKARIAGTVQHDVVFEFLKITNWQKSVVFESKEPPQENDTGEYDYTYNFMYSPEQITADNNPCEITVVGHESVPFKITIPTGGKDLEWQLIVDGTVVESGKLIGEFYGMVEIDTTQETQDIRYNGNSVREYRDFSNRKNFFEIPIGQTIINVRNVRNLEQYTVEIFEQMRDV